MSTMKLLKFSFRSQDDFKPKFDHVIIGRQNLLKGQNTKPFTTENEFSALITHPTDLNDNCFNAFGKLSNVHSAWLGPLKPYPARFRAMVGKLEPRSAEMSSLIINEILICI